MLDELKTDSKKVGFKQSIKALREDCAKKAFVAKEADNYLLSPFLDECRKKNINIEYCETLKELGEACGINIGAAVAVLLK